MSAPSSGNELFAAFTEFAAREPQRRVLHWVAEANGETVHYTWADLLQLARRGHAALRAAGVGPGERVLFALPTGEALIAGILGAFHAGAVAAAVAPPARRHPAAAAELSSYLRLLRPRAYVSEQPLDGLAELWLAPEQLRAAGPAAVAERWHPPGGPAFVQFSSGSTGAPKAIVLGLPEICSNLAMIRDGIGVQAGERGVSWLPLHHDMGVFGCLLSCLYSGAELTLFDSGLFLRQPLLWFRLLQRERATTTASSPSALLAALKLLALRPIEGLDLSSCTRWILGAEPVTPRFLRQVEQALGPYGLRREHLCPMYGMAEITLAATAPPRRRPPPVDVVDGAALEAHGRARPAAGEEPTAQEYTGVGAPLPGVALAIRDQAGNPLGDRHVGRIWLRSASSLQGTMQDGALQPRREPWWDSGDLGYTVGDELFITGRARHVIIQGGRNVCPERLEDLAETVAGVHRAAALGVYHEGLQTERIVLLVEVHPRQLEDALERDRLRLQLRAALAGAGYELAECRFVARGALPRTTSGKLVRPACLRLYREESAAAAAPQP